MHALRWFDPGDGGLDPFGNGHRVLAGLALHGKADGGLAVEPGQRSLGLKSVFGKSQITKFYEPAVPVGDHQIIKCLGCFKLALGLNDIFSPGIFDPAAGDLPVLATQGHFDIIGSQRGRFHFFPVYPDPHLARAAAAHGHRPDSGNLFDIPFQDLVSIMRQVLYGAISPDSDPNDGLVLGADLLDHRRVRVLRQTIADGGNLITNVLGSLFKVSFKIEFHGYDGIFLHTARRDGLYSAYRVHGLFDRVRDVYFHDLRTCADKFGRDVNHREIDLREQVEGELGKSHNAEHDERQTHHGHEHRPFYCYFR